jgi:hypothetical protein
MTVDRAHATVDAATSHQQLYVAATRGRHANDLWVALDSDRDLIGDDTHLPDPQQLLARALARKDPDRLAAHQLADDSLTELHSLARLGAIFEDAARNVTDRWLGTKLAAHGLEHADRDAEWGSLLDRTRQLALQGHDLDQLLDRAITMRPIDDAHSLAGVLHWRLEQLARHIEPARRPGPLGSLPTLDGGNDEHLALARAAGELIRRRWQQLRTQLETTAGPLPYAAALGPRPADPTAARLWVTAAAAVTAYRERYEAPDHVQLLGERPGQLRTDAQAAYGHAQLQVNSYLTRLPCHLDLQQSPTLRGGELGGGRGSSPRFDPAQLQAAHQHAEQARRAWITAEPHERAATQRRHQQTAAVVDDLEALAARHRIASRDDHTRELRPATNHPPRRRR